MGVPKKGQKRHFLSISQKFWWAPYILFLTKNRDFKNRRGVLARGKGGQKLGFLRFFSIFEYSSKTQFSIYLQKQLLESVFCILKTRNQFVNFVTLSFKRSDHLRTSCWNKSRYVFLEVSIPNVVKEHFLSWNTTQCAYCLFWYIHQNKHWNEPRKKTEKEFRDKQKRTTFPL